MTTYNLIDTHTKVILKTYTKRSTATKRADKLDNAYGAYRYSVQPIFNKEV